MPERFLHCAFDHLSQLKDAGPAMDILFLPEVEQRKLFKTMVIELVSLMGREAALSVLGKDTDWKRVLEAPDIEETLKDTWADTLRYMLAYLMDAIDVSVLFEWVAAAQSLRAKANELQRSIHYYVREGNE